MADHLGRFGAYLGRAIELLARDAPAHFVILARRLGSRAVLIVVDGEPPAHVQIDRPPWVTVSHEIATVTVRVGPRDLDALVAGALGVEEALWNDRLHLRGALDDVLAFLDGLAAWLHGALRAPALATLHRAFMAGDPIATFPRTGDPDES